MKKVSELLKPFLSVIFGVLLFLNYFNWLSYKGGYLAVGIIGVTLAVYFVTLGIIEVCLGGRFYSKTKRVFDGIGLVSFPSFLGAYFLIHLILCAKNEIAIGPMGWTLAIYSIGVAFGLVLFLFITYFGKKHKLFSLTTIFSFLFGLALLLDVLMVNGNPATLGSIRVLVVVLYGVFVAMLFKALQETEKLLKKESKPEEKPAEEKAK